MVQRFPVKTVGTKSDPTNQHRCGWCSGCWKPRQDIRRHNSAMSKLLKVLPGEKGSFLMGWHPFGGSIYWGWRVGCFGVCGPWIKYACEQHILGCAVCKNWWTDDWWSHMVRIDWSSDRHRLNREMIIQLNKWHTKVTSTNSFNHRCGSRLETSSWLVAPSPFQKFLGFQHVSTI